MSLIGQRSAGRNCSRPLLFKVRELGLSSVCRRCSEGKPSPRSMCAKACRHASLTERLRGTLSVPLQGRGVRATAGRAAGHRGGRLARLRGRAQGAVDPEGRPGLCRSGLRDRARLAASAGRDYHRAGRTRQSRPLAYPADHGSSRTKHTCPGEMSKSWRLVELARQVFESSRGFAVDVLDFSPCTSEVGRNIHPCKSCASTAMPLCH
jgi:hypothetical protein